MNLPFMDIFKDWAKDYDTAVGGHDEQYHEVFIGYDQMLDDVALYVEGTVLEFGVGTGNLSARILKGHPLIAIEPSPEMRQIAIDKLGISVENGDFLRYPSFSQVDTVVSSYAFHHLTDSEKESAIDQYVREWGHPKFVLLDTMFESPEARQDIIDWATAQGYSDLVEDLNREYYPYTTTIRTMLEANGYNVTMTQKNKFVWLVVATK
ncbi:methyltransferase domain-containing protein [Exiguobacterium aestuarii]|uniref:Methyltransferase domain-containing protein n=1 Tax=Exiguobacterium aestuarii TaxID=273527 RepID=A0ABW2PIZ2_9BACL|nr:MULTISPECIES: class I SAM-dependent methyltransferase [Exiguobacterium]MCT4786803.1 class I SAM-dependent methyltransferase [Exiguobacterium aestuarii]